MASLAASKTAARTRYCCREKFGEKTENLVRQDLNPRENEDHDASDSDTASLHLASLMRSSSVVEVIDYDESRDDFLFDVSDIERREKERIDRKQKSNHIVHDASGLDIYLEECERMRALPNNQIVRQLGNYQLQLRHSYLKETDVAALTAALKANTIVEDLDLSDNHLEDDLGERLFGFLRTNGFVSHFNVAQNCLRSRALVKLCRTMLTNTSVRSLVLASNEFGDEDAKTLADFLQATTTLTNLDLSKNSFGDKGGVFLGAALEMNDSLRELDLSWNKLRLKGAVAVCSALAVNDSLEIIDLSWNGLAFGGAVALGKALRVNGTLKVLDISNNRIEAEGAKQLAIGLAKNSSLETLLLGQNPLGERGVKSLLDGIEGHQSLRVLDLKDVVVSHENFARIHQLQKSTGVFVPTGGTWSGIKSDDPGPSSLEALSNFVTENNLRLVDVFNRFDKDKSGDISMVELRNGLKEIGIKMTNRQLDALLDEIDEDNSGTIDYQEFLTSRIGVQLSIREERKAVKRAKRMRKLKIKREMELPELDRMKLADLFAKFDADRSGDITVAEFKIGLKEVGVRLTEVQLQSLVDELDVDGSGTIDYAEFKAKLLVDAPDVGRGTPSTRATPVTPATPRAREAASILRISTPESRGQRARSGEKKAGFGSAATPSGEGKKLTKGKLDKKNSTLNKVDGGGGGGGGSKSVETSKNGKKLSKKKSTLGKK